MRRVGIVGVVLLSVWLVPAADGRYRSTGVLLDYDRAELVPGPALRFDRHRVVQQLYGGRWYHNPFTVAQQGLIDYSQGRRRGALKIADWLVRRQHRDGTWRYRFPFVASGLMVTVRPPWSSALAQGAALCLLRRAFHLTHRRRYARAARAAVKPFRRLTDDGGVAARVRGHRFFEEYPTRPPSAVLNGFAYSLIGLYD